VEGDSRAPAAIAKNDNVSRGMSPAEARRQALVRFGGVERVQESYRA